MPVPVTATSAPNRFSSGIFRARQLAPAPGEKSGIFNALLSQKASLVSTFLQVWSLRPKAGRAPLRGAALGGGWRTEVSHD